MKYCRLLRRLPAESPPFQRGPSPLRGASSRKRGLRPVNDLSFERPRAPARSASAACTRPPWSPDAPVRYGCSEPDTPKTMKLDRFAKLFGHPSSLSTMHLFGFYFRKALRRTPPLAYVLCERRWRWSDWIFRSSSPPRQILRILNSLV